jgi:pimeloyl-ACP methyl ester carboxylesterase
MNRLFSIALALAVCACAGRYAHPLPPEAVHHRARTADGWDVALVQYLPQGTPRGRPVLLCHGISANARHMDLDEVHSLARHLARSGREAWTMSIRGTGDSARAGDAQGEGRGYSFDTVWQNDHPAAIAYVRAHAFTPGRVAEARARGEALSASVLALAEPEPLLDYVGHSMGGMLIYAYLSQGGQGLSAVVTLGSPTRLDWGGPVEPWVARASRRLLSETSLVPMSAAAVASMPLQGYVPGTPLERLLYNPENTTRASWRRLVAVGTGDVSGALWFQLSDMVVTGRFQSADGTVDYRRDMARIRNPVLVVAGKVDRIATPPAVRDGYRALGGPKEWFVAGEENGLFADYGHLDLLIGQKAHQEIFPRVVDFLDRHP